MRTWKIEVGFDEDHAAARQGYVLAASHEEARRIATAAHPYPVTKVFEMHPDEPWPGRIGEVISWSN